MLSLKKVVYVLSCECEDWESYFVKNVGESECCSGYGPVRPAKLSQVVEPLCYKDTSDKTVQESANRGKRLAFDASMLASSSSTVKSEVPQLPEPNQNRDIGNCF